MVALFYDWWNIFVRLIEPDRHVEAITSRPLLLHGIATRVRHARQIILLCHKFVCCVVRWQHGQRGKVVRGEATRFKYDSGVQPAPKLGAWLAVLTGILVAEAKLPRRERHCPSNLWGWARIRQHTWARSIVTASPGVEI